MYLSNLSWSRISPYIFRIGIVGLLGLISYLLVPEGFFGNLLPEILSVILTVLILDKLASDREAEREFRQLVQDMGGQSNEFAKRAVMMLRHNPKRYLLNGALHNLTFENANLLGANLEEASLVGTYLEGAILVMSNLKEANLEYAYLAGANLTQAYLWGISLKHAYLVGANLSEAYLEHAHLEDAELVSANLAGACLAIAHLERADMAGADLTGADLTWADFSDATFGGDTLMPDGRLWTPETDLEQFTNPHHPNFFIT